VSRRRHRLAAVALPTGVALACLASCGATGDDAASSGAAAALASPQPDRCITAPTPTPAPGPDAFCTRPPSETVSPDGLAYGDFAVGGGPTLHDGETVRVQYTGWLQSSGAMFDSSRGPGRSPFSFTLGGGRVIRGWDEGVRGMHVGGKRRLVIPPALAYGPQGRPPTIPPAATLVFDIEVVGLG
jgi:hypothetical protein